MACCDRTTGFLTGVLLVEIAQYIPASNNAVNRIPDILFMAGFSEAQIAPAEYTP